LLHQSFDAVLFFLFFVLFIYSCIFVFFFVILIYCLVHNPPSAGRGAGGFYFNIAAYPAARSAAANTRELESVLLSPWKLEKPAVPG